MSVKLFNNVILNFTDSFYRFALSILKDTEAAKDAVQDCLAKIWDKRQSLDSLDNPRAWAMKIVRNHCLDILRSHRPLMDIADNPAVAGGEAPDFELLYQDQQRWYDQTVATLPTKQREIFHLREVEEMSYQEIADVLGLNMSEVKVSLHRARTRARSTLNKVEAYGT